MGSPGGLFEREKSLKTPRVIAKSSPHRNLSLQSESGSACAAGQPRVAKDQLLEDARPHVGARRLGRYVGGGSARRLQYFRRGVGMRNQLAGILLLLGDHRRQTHDLG